MKIRLLGLGFVVGVIFVLVLLFIQSIFLKTIIYEAKHDIVLKNGSMICKGTELIKEKEMPEGFDLLKIYINYSGNVENDFRVRIDSRNNLIIPYWVDNDDLN